MGQVNWFDRKFDFAINQNIMPSIIERLEGTPIRIKEKLSKIDSSFYKIQPEGKWSMLEHVGHLVDLEPLWQGRLDDILSGQKELRLADLNNTKTIEANHNATPVLELINSLDALREMTVARLRNLEDVDVFKSALHPRLKTPMRTIDLFTFVAEHDDHHLAKITEINTFFKTNKSNQS
jgi:uncharacterized damage-inducible protein DinB